MHPALSAPLCGLLALLAAVPLRAGVPEAVSETILPGYEGFTAATAALDTAARADCSAEALKAPWNAAFDAWMAVSHLRIGPSETAGRALAIAFWPDPKGSGARTQARLLEAADPDLLAPERFAEVSVAARGLFALERLLYDPAFAGDYACALTRATAADLARMAADLETDWRETFAPLVLTAGRDGNDRFLTEAEARQALFTQLMAGLEFTADQRLGRPLGSFDRPVPSGPRRGSRAAACAMSNCRSPPSNGWRWCLPPTARAAARVSIRRGRGQPVSTIRASTVWRTLRDGSGWRSCSSGCMRSAMCSRPRSAAPWA